MLRSVKYGLYGAVLAGLIAVPAVWLSVDKSVHLVVDGHAETIRTTAAQVGDVLEDHDVSVHGHDLLAPSAKSQVHDGMHVVLRRGRLLHLDVDGHAVNVWTTAPTVKQALEQLGYDTSDFVSVSRSRRLPLSPSDIAIRTPRQVTVVHDGKRDQVTTTDATVGEVLADLHVVPGTQDKLSAGPSTQISDGQTIVLQRVSHKTLTRTEVLKYTTTKHNDDKLAKGSTHVVTKGRDGKSKVTYSVVYVDGKEVGRTRVGSVTIDDARTKVVNIGTKKIVGSGGPAQDIARELLAKKGYGESQMSCLVQMWDRESHWNVHAANPSGAYGIPQALPGSKMSSAGPNWESDAETQIKWGLSYIDSRYGTPCDAWSFWQAHNYY